MKYRDQRGTLAESLETTIELAPTLNALAKHIGVDAALLSVKHYAYDPRCGWNVYIVTSDQGVHGMTDGPVDDWPDVVHTKCT